MVARSRSDIDRSSASVNERGAGRAVGFAVDVRDADAVAAMVTEAEAELGAITALINNAGTPGPAGLDWEVDPAEWWECIESIVRGSFNCTRAVMPGMLAQGGGRIIDIASVTGTTAWPLVSATSVAKTALIRHAENLAAVASAHNVQVFALHPGMVRTKLLLSYRSHPTFREFLDTAPDEAYAPPELSAAVVARIVAGDLDRYSGRFVDATADLDRDDASLDEDALTLRLGEVRTPT